MTAEGAKLIYTRLLSQIETLKAELRDARTKATEASNLYGRLCREELRASTAKDQPPAGTGGGE